MVGSLLNLIYLQRLTGINYEFKRLAKLSFITLIMGIGVKIIFAALVGADINSHISTLLAISAGVGIYGILLLLFREFDLNMIKRMSKV
jgi:stage V sporulation protein B